MGVQEPVKTLAGNLVTSICNPMKSPFFRSPLEISISPHFSTLETGDRIFVKKSPIFRTIFPPFFSERPDFHPFFCNCLLVLFLALLYHSTPASDFSHKWTLRLFGFMGVCCS